MERRCRARVALPRQAIHLAVAAALLVGAGGCNVVDAMRSQPVRIVKMVPGANVATGGLDCWLTLEIDAIPDGVDPRSLAVRFESAALTHPADFDWSYIADHDVRPPESGQLGTGHQPATTTRPEAAPPTGETIKIRFALPAREIVADAPSPLWLEARVTWGGTIVDSERRTIEHVYSRTGSGFF